MPFLTLNGVTVRVGASSVTMNYVDVGSETARSPTGDLVGGPSTTKREWRMTTTPVPGTDADAWAALLDGKGHSWSFDDDLYSSRGRGPSYSAGAALIVGGAKHGAAALRVGAGDAVTYTLGLSAWTVLLWRLESGTWRHYLVTSGGHRWKDGVRNDALTTSTFVNVASGVLQVGDFGGATGIRDFDDVVALPYVVPDAWADSLYAQHSASAWSSMPRLSATGTFAPDAVTVRGKVTEMTAVRHSYAGALTTGYTLDFTLREV